MNKASQQFGIKQYELDQIAEEKKAFTQDVMPIIKQLATKLCNQDVIRMTGQTELEHYIF